MSNITISGDGSTITIADETTHPSLTGRSDADQHPTSAITGLDTALAVKWGIVEEVVWNQVTPTLVYSVPAGHVATSITVEVTETWDGTGAAITLGNGVTPDLYLQATETELTALASFEKTIHTSAASTIYVAITPGLGASQGKISIHLSSLPQGT